MRDAPIKTSAFRQGIREVSATAKEELGTLRVLQDGRKFRYAKAGAAALAVGKATVAAAIAAAHADAVIAAANTSGTQVTLTVTAGTAIAENALAGGYMMVNDGILEGNCFRIDSNTAMASDGTAITLGLVDPVVGYTGATEVTLCHNPFSGLIISATPEAMPTGIAPVTVPAGYYFWTQTGGPCAALIVGTPAVGTMLTHGATDGSVGAINATLDIDQPIIGVSWGLAGVATEYQPVFLTID
jgi:hypothetical protein